MASQNNGMDKGKIIAIAVGSLLGGVIFLAQPLGLVPSALIALGVGLGVGFMIVKMSESDGTASRMPDGTLAANGKIDASATSAVSEALLGNNKAARDTLASGDALLSMLTDKQAAARDPVVSSEISELFDDVSVLYAYVRSHPSEYQLLGSFLASYADQTEQILNGYLTMETYGGGSVTNDSMYRARASVIGALNALEGAARGIISRVSAERGTAVTASADAISHLVEMQGYHPDQGTPGDIAGSIDGSAGSEDTVTGRTVLDAARELTMLAGQAPGSIVDSTIGDSVPSAVIAPSEDTGKPLPSSST